MEFLDPRQGFMPYPRVQVAHTPEGPLRGLTFGVKDLFDVAGYPTSAGQPFWLAQSGVKDVSANVVASLLQAGAACAGKTITDEFAFSIIGDNAHFGAPMNPAAPERFAGGSSSGSASVVAHHLVDFSIGTDTGGSVRAPASNCGILGLRPTHGRVSLEGAHALAPSFDTCGWFARDIEVLSRVSEVLLGVEIPGLSVQPELLRPIDLYSLVSSEIAQTFTPAENCLAQHFGEFRNCRILTDPVTEMVECFRTVQGFEAWELHGGWIQEYQPAFGPGVAERFKWASSVSLDQYRAANARRRRFCEQIRSLLSDRGLLVLPTVGDIAPLRGSALSVLEDYRKRAFSLLCIAGLAGLPQLSLPLASHRGAPLGLSLIGPVGGDEWLISVAKVLLAGFSLDRDL
jgi:amidase